MSARRTGQENATPEAAGVGSAEHPEQSRLEELAASQSDDEITRLLLEQSSLADGQMSEKDQLEYSMELNRQLKAMEARLDGADADLALPPHAAQKSGKSRVVNAGSPTSRSSSTSGSRSVGPSPSGRSTKSSKHSKAKPLHQPRIRTHTQQEEIAIRRHNLGLLSNLERIQRKGGGTDNRPKPKVKHVAAARINRAQAQRNVINQNMQFLKRLNGVKSTMRTDMGKGKARPQMGGGSMSPHTRQHAKQKQRKAKRPEWVDIPVGPEARR